MGVRLTFNMLLADAGISPGDVRLMRHQQVASDGLTPYALWRDQPSEFERYQSAQRVDRRTRHVRERGRRDVIHRDAQARGGASSRVGGADHIARRGRDNGWRTHDRARRCVE